MKQTWIRIFAVTAMAASLSGCAAFYARTTDVNVEETNHLNAKYDYSDMRTVSQGIVDNLLQSRFLAELPEPPVMMIAGVQNRTSQYLDTKNLTDRIRTLIFESERIRFVNEARREDLMREQGYSAANASLETQVAIGKQLGARYMITGSLTEMQSSSPKEVRVSKTQVTYYKLTFEITDLQSNEIRWMCEKEFAREARQPLVGW